MKKIVTLLSVMTILLCVVCSSLAANKVVVIPLGGKATFETVSHTFSIPGTSFLPLRSYSQTEANGYTVTRRNPSSFLSFNLYGVAHNKDGAKMTFTAPVHLPDGAHIGHIGAAVCSNDSSLPHYININLMKMDMTTGFQTSVRSYNITNTNCNTAQGSSGLILPEAVDNSKYTYEFMISGIEGGECVYTSGFPFGTWNCDDRRTRIQYAHINYTTSEVKQP